VTAVPEERWSIESIASYANEQIVVGSDYPRIFFDDPELPEIDDIPILSVDNAAIKTGVIQMTQSMFANRRQIFDTIRTYPFLYEYYLDMTDFEESDISYIVSSYKMYLDALALTNSFDLSPFKIGATETYNALLPIGKNNRLTQVRVIPLDKVEYSEYMYVYNGPDEVYRRQINEYDDGLHTLLYRKNGKTHACRLVFFE
jgi:hypothetical protein